MKNPILFLVLSLFSIGLQAQTTISSSVSITQSDINSYAWPVTISGGTISSPVVVTLGGNILLDDVNKYFIIESDYVDFNGNNNSVTIENVSDYPGLVQNGTSVSSGFSNVSIINTRVLSSFSTLLTYGGWIGQGYFANGAVDVNISNCSSDGDISDNSGGIMGSFCAAAATHCHSTGHISDAAGGVFGAESSGTATYCYSRGNMGNWAGGIFGNLSSASASNCYSTGSIGEASGGIMANGNTGTATDCFSLGNISRYGGGIFGTGGAGYVTNCYSNGNIGNDAGGIMGAYNSGVVDNCYSTGLVGASAGGIVGFSHYGTYSNTYFTNGDAWVDADANNNLINVGSTWAVTGANIPYLLFSFNASLYSPDNASVSEGTSSSFAAGNFTTGSYLIFNMSGNPSGYSSFTMNSVSGIASVANAVAGSYVLDVLYSDADGFYQINTFSLEVLSTLPVTWRSFTVAPRGNDAWLQWSTSSEQNTRDFNVQHSINGSNWTTISTMTAAGNSNAISSYSYLHADPVNGNNYYRIQQADLDGKYNYSGVRQLQVAVTGKSFSVINTVVSNGVLQVEVNASSTLSLYNINGKLLWKKELNAGLKHIDLSMVSKGVYFLKGNDATEKIVVQ